VRGPDDDDEMLRIVASCANEAVEAHHEQHTRGAAAARAVAHGTTPLQRVASRYAKTLHLQLRDLYLALGDASRAQVKTAAQHQEN
jgi:hypothetical protein